MPTRPAPPVVSHHHIQTAYEDPGAWPAGPCVADAVTTEFENVPAAALAALAATPVSPAASAVSVAQDRAREKAHFVACGVPCAPYAVIETAEQLAAVSPTCCPAF